MFGPDKKRGLMLILGKPKKKEMEGESEDEVMQDEEKEKEVKEDAGKQLAEAIDSGSGEAIYQAIVDIFNLHNE